MSNRSDEGLGLQRLERAPTALGALVAFAVVVTDAWGLFQFVSGPGAADQIHALRSYIWTSFGTLLVLGMVVAWYHHRLGIRVTELRGRELAIRLQHLLAEEVRRCAADPSKYRWDDFKEASSKIKEFLAHRLPGVQCAITVKKIEGAQLRAVFRGGDQDLTQRRVGDRLALHESHVYLSFRAYPRGQKRWVYIRDTENVADRSYSERAKACDFRSVVAFPLREPVQLDNHQSGPPGIDVANLRGFWSLDSDEEDAFIDLFRADRLRRHRDNDGKGLMPRADIQAFYGIADCIATILMLKDSAATTEGSTDAIP